MKRHIRINDLAFSICTAIALIAISEANPANVGAAPWQQCQCQAENCSCGQADCNNECQSCPQCHNDDCVLRIKKVCDEQSCYKTEQKVVCVPKIHWPWNQDCEPIRSKSRTVKVLKEHFYKCERCAYEWGPEALGEAEREITRPAEILPYTYNQTPVNQFQGDTSQNLFTDALPSPPALGSVRSIPQPPNHYSPENYVPIAAPPANPGPGNYSPMVAPPMYHSIEGSPSPTPPMTSPTQPTPPIPSSTMNRSVQPNLPNPPALVNTPAQPVPRSAAPPATRPDPSIIDPPAVNPGRQPMPSVARPITNPNHLPIRAPVPPSNFHSTTDATANIPNPGPRSSSPATSAPTRPSTPIPAPPTRPIPSPPKINPTSTIPDRMIAQPIEAMVPTPAPTRVAPRQARPVTPEVSVTPRPVPKAVIPRKNVPRQAAPPVKEQRFEVPKFPRDVYPPFAEPFHESSSRAPAPTRYRPFVPRSAASRPSASRPAASQPAGSQTAGSRPAASEPVAGLTDVSRPNLGQPNLPRQVVSQGLNRPVPSPAQAPATPIPDQFLLSTKPVLATFSDAGGGAEAIPNTIHGASSRPANKNDWIRLSDEK